MIKRIQKVLFWFLTKPSFLGQPMKWPKLSRSSMGRASFLPSVGSQAAVGIGFWIWGLGLRALGCRFKALGFGFRFRCWAFGCGASRFRLGTLSLG